MGAFVSVQIEEKELLINDAECIVLMLEKIKVLLNAPCLDRKDLKDEVSKVIKVADSHCVFLKECLFSGDCVVFNR